jgi:hypothetical protein
MNGDMGTFPNALPCDGCGLPASPEHIAERLRRLELSTRFRPVHIGILFVVLSPAARPQDDFYGPPESRECLQAFLEGLQISSSADDVKSAPVEGVPVLANLSEFQHRGYYLAYLSECPIPAGHEDAATTVARLAPTLLRRIRFNYKPKLIAPLGQELAPLVDILKGANIAPILTLDRALPLPSPGTGGRDWAGLFQRAVAAAAPGEYLSSGYDRIRVIASGSDLGAGGKL